MRERINKNVVISALVVIIFIALACMPAVDNTHMPNKPQEIGLKGKQDKNLLTAEGYSHYFRNNVLEMNFTFHYSGNLLSAQHVVKKGDYGTVSVYSHGNTIYMDLTVRIAKNIKGVAGDCSGTYYKFPKNHEAALEVVKIPEIFGVSPADIIAVFGAAVATGIGGLESAVEGASYIAYAAVGAEIADTIGVVLAADYLALSAYAHSQNDPTVYFDIGVSWGTKWWNFEEIGMYGEEGAFTGSADSHSSGLFVPVALAGGHNYSPKSWKFFAQYSPHNSVWNPFQEPPW
jgi:hypothetical protein